MEQENKYPTAKEAFDWLRESPVGKAWQNVKCPCRELLKDDPCDLNCKEFHDETLPNFKTETKN